MNDTIKLERNGFNLECVCGECNCGVYKDDLFDVIPKGTYSEKYNMYTGNYNIEIYKCSSCGELIFC